MSSWGIVVLRRLRRRGFCYCRRGFTPSVVLCDQRLRSGESGFEILKALLERLPKVSGAMVSGEFNSPVLRDAEEEGYLVLRKPLEPATLHALLTQWSASQQRARQKRGNSPPLKICVLAIKTPAAISARTTARPFILRFSRK
jgi:DNA-binding NtrC family response regulator